jgi:hypothetical protein
MRNPSKAGIPFVAKGVAKAGTPAIKPVILALERFPKSVTRFSDKKRDKQKESGASADSLESGNDRE